MRSHLLARRTRSLVKTLPTLHRAQLSSTHALRYPRKDSQSTPRLSRRTLSSEIAPHDLPETSSTLPPSATPPPDDGPAPAAAADSPAAPPPEDAEEKPKRRPRASPTPRDASESVALPEGLNILWTPEGDTGAGAAVDGTTLPPPEIFNEALHNLHVALHPQTQHRSAYASGGAPLVEPALALYCPIEGGDYVLDETVREMARRTGADVVVLDAVQLAAGECGHFGKGASVLRVLCFLDSVLPSRGNDSRLGTAVAQ